VQENTNPRIPAGQNLKRIDYDYDLISGKVNDVHYQNRQPDAFHHHYEYDADNRITEVYTSKFPVAVWKGYKDQFWDNDAKYFYYLHGPLARTEIGDDKVQGMDYAYTLQGWIKGVNSNTLEAKRDMGKDGLTQTGNPNQNFAQDAYGYTLGYFNQDYSAASGVVWNNVSNRFEAYIPVGNALRQNSYDLYNGNISRMVTTICDSLNNPLPQGMAYQYDQLNRLIRAEAFTNLDTTTNTWNTGRVPAPMRYLNTFTYDANGNILTQQLNDQFGGTINNLTYRYNRDASGNLLQNRLYHVNNSVAPNTHPNELNDEGVFSPASQTINAKNNYNYDELGELKKDSAQQIQSIKWTVYGKIKEIDRYAGSSKNNLRFDYDAGGVRVAKHVYSSSNVWLNSTYYLKDAQGNVMNVYTNRNNAYQLTEEDMYGSSRLGLRNDSLELIGSMVDTLHYNRILGRKYFEEANHLGNVLTVFSDKKLPIFALLDPTKTDHSLADIVSSTDYYPFGAPMPGRNFNLGAYKYQFNGKECDPEVFGQGNEEDFGARIYDPRLGRWLSVDPLFNHFPDWSPYVGMSNNPIKDIDPTGAGTESTHVNDLGNVISEVKDGDNSVYLHKDEKTKEDIDKKYTTGDHSAGGSKIGDLGGNINMNGFFGNVLSVHAKIAEGLNIGEWARKVAPGHPWDLKANSLTIFGAAWQFEQDSKHGDVNGIGNKTSFSYNGMSFRDAADVGNYHAGFTGTYAGVSYRSQWAGAGLAEQLKNHSLGAINPLNYAMPPHGDAPMDYFWNTKGMTDAANQRNMLTPVQEFQIRATQAQKMNTMMDKGHKE
jgi:RHS repeat-associated protein